MGQRGSLLQAQTSAIQVDVLDSGSFETQRLDLLVGSSTRGVLFTSSQSQSRYTSSHLHCPRRTHTASLVVM